MASVRPVVLLMGLISCSQILYAQESYRCDFEADLCWMYVAPFGIPWMRRNQADLLADNVPNRPDELANNQWYLSLTPAPFGSFDASEPNIAIARTPVIHGGVSLDGTAKDFCLSYWLYMASDQPNEFRVSIAEIETSAYYVLQSFTGNAAPAWRRESVKFQQRDAFQLDLFAMILPVSQANFFQLALDDLTVAKGLC